MVAIAPLPGSLTEPVQAQGSPELRVTASDYATTLSEVFGPDAMAYVVLTDAGRSVPDSRGIVQMRATTTPSQQDSGVRFDLLETGIGTGIFLGGFQFGSPAQDAGAHPVLGRIGIEQNGQGDWVSKNARLSVADGDTVTVRTVQQQSTTQRTTTFKWFDAATAQTTVTGALGQAIPLNQDRPLVGFGEQLNLQITDPDLNRDATKVETRADLLRAFSDSDPAGEAITLTESGQDANTFGATIRFESTQNAGNGRLFVRDGDRITIEYAEPRNAQGERQIHQIPNPANAWTFAERTDGAILADRATYFGETTADRNARDRAEIVIIDSDQRSKDGTRAGTIQVTATTGSNCDPASSTQFKLNALQLGGQSNTFVGTLGFTKGASDAGATPPLLSVTDKATVTVCYRDFDHDNQARTRTHSFTWRDITNAGLELSGGDQRLVGTGRDFTITLDDADANRNPSSTESLTVRVKSSSDATQGLAVTLTETGPDTAFFTGTFQFTTGTTGDGKIKVTDRDRVVVEYDDGFTLPDGTERVQRSQYAVWRAATDATVSTDRSVYLPGLPTGDTRYRNHAIVSLEDADQSTPLRRDTLVVDVIPISGGASATQLTLTETGLNTGLFVGFLGFDTAGSDPDVVGVGDPSTTFRIRYQEALPSGGSRFVQTGTLTVWKAPPSSAAEMTVQRDVSLQGLGWGQVADKVYDDDESARVVVNAQSSQLFAQQVRVGSSICEHVRVFDLTEAGVHRWAADVDLTLIANANQCTTPASLCQNQEQRVCVSLDGTLEVEVTMSDGQTVLTTAVPVRDRPDETVIFTQPGETSQIPRAGGEQRGVGVRVTGWGHNFNTQLRQFLEVEVESRDRATPMALLLTETGADTGVFTGAFQTTEASQAGRLPVRAGMGLIRDDALPGGYDLYDAIEVRTPADPAQDYDGLRSWVTWYPADDAVLLVEREGFGTGSFLVDLVDGDGLSHRKFDRRTTVADQQSYNYANGPGIAGSEVVLVHRRDTQNFNSGSGEFTTTVHAGQGDADSAAEAIADRNRDGIVGGALGCRDVTLVGSRVPAVGNPVNVQVTCVNVEAGNGDGEVTFLFQDPAVGSGSTCSPSAVNTCRIEVRYAYRPATVGSCQGQNAGAYTRTAEGIRLCLAPQAGRDLDLEYQASRRSVSVVGTSETETMTLTYDTGLGRYRGSIQAETSAGANNGKIHVGDALTTIRFNYADPTQTFDGQAGNSGNGHFRSVRALGLWRPAQDGTIHAMQHDFSAPAAGTVFGPAVPVRVEDSDANRHDRQDTLTIKARSGANEIDVVLRETSKTSGSFRGVVPIQQSGLPGGLPVPSGSITLEYNDPFSASGGQDLRTAVLSWQAAATATASVEGGTAGVFRGTSVTFNVEIADADRNANPNVVESVQARLRSWSDPVGEPITLLETGLDTGVFRATGLRFESANVPGNGRIFVSDGDEFWVTYLDPLDESGVQRVVDSARRTWQSVSDGIVRFDRSFQIGATPGAPGDAPVGLQKLARAGVTISDADRSEPRKVSVIGFTGGPSLRVGPVDPSNGQIIGADALTSLSFVETGHDTGVFLAVFSFRDGGSSESAEALPTAFGRVPMQPGQFVRVEYTDPETTASQNVFSGEAQWFQPGFGVIRFDRSGYGDYASQPRVTVYDSNIAGNPNQVAARAVSEAAPDGVSLTLQRRSDAPEAVGGIYTGTLSLSSSASGGALHVNEEDELEARYQDGTPAGTRTHTAVFIFGLDDPPVTSLSTTPSAPDGENDWFITAPQVSFTTNRPASHIAMILYRFGSGDVDCHDQVLQAWDGEPFTLAEGVHDIQFCAIDVIGNVEETNLETVSVSLTDPTVAVTGLQATSRPGGNVELVWDAVGGKADPLTFGEYRLYRGSNTTQVGNSTAETLTDLPSEDGTYTYFVKVVNAAGRISTATAPSVQGISDRVAPVIDAFQVSPQTLREAQGEDTVSTTLSVTQATLSDTQRVELRVFDPFGDAVENISMSRDGTTRVWNLQYSGFEVCGDYDLVGVAADLAGNEDTRNATVRYIAADREAPRLSNLLEQIPPGVPLTVTVRDNCRGIASIAYTIEGQNRVTVPVSGTPLEHVFTIPADRLSLGDNSITFELVDANDTANRATITRVITVTTGGSGEPPAGAPTISGAARLVEHGGQFRFTVRSQTPLTALTLDAGDAPRNVLAAWQQATGFVRADVGDLAAGPHTVTVRATNAIGSHTQTFSFWVLDAGVPLPPENVVVTTDSRGRPVIDWDASPSDASKVGGYIVHRQTNPWEVIAVVGADTFKHTDTTARSGQSYRYAVTAYGVNGEGRLNVGENSESLAWFGGYVDSQAVETENIGGVSILLWIGLIVIAVIVAVGLVYANRERLFRSREEYEEEYPDEAETPFGVERHHLRCPNCSNDFHVAGERPIVTECPNCGRKGILR